MNIQQLRLDNIRSYDDQTVSFPDGTILIHGENGAGKSSLLMGIFGGLFLSNIRNVGNNSFSLEDMVRRSTSNGEIELVFTVNGIEYTVLWQLYRTSTPNSAELRSPELSQPIDGIRAVHSEVVGLLGMDEEDFANSVYIQQGGIDRLIEATDRAKMIDGLLGLDQIDEYRERVKMARRAAGQLERSATDNAASRRQRLEEQFDRSVETLSDEIAEVSSAISTLESQLDDADELLDTLTSRISELESKLERYETVAENLDEARSELNELEKSRGDLQADRADKQNRVDKLDDDIRSLREELRETTSGVEVDADLTDSDTAADARSSIQEEKRSAEREVANLKTALAEAEATVADIERSVEKVESERDETQEELEQYEDMLESSIERQSEAEERREEMEPDLLADIADFISEVDTVDEVPYPEEDDYGFIEDPVTPLVEDHRDELADSEQSARDRITEIEATVVSEQDLKSRLEDELDGHQENLADMEASLADKREAAETAVNAAEALDSEFNTRFDSVVDRADQLSVELDSDVENNLSETADLAVGDAIGQVESELQAARDEASDISSKASRIEEDQAELEALSDAGECPRCGQAVEEAHIDEELATLGSELETAREQQETVSSRIDRLTSREEQLDELQRDLRDLHQFKQSELKPAERERDRVRDVRDRVETEVEELETTVAGAESEVGSVAETITELEDEKSEVESTVEETTTAIEEAEALLERIEQWVETIEIITSSARSQEHTRERINEELQPQQEAAEEELEELHEELIDAQETVAQLKADREEAQATVEKLTPKATALDTIYELHDELDSVVDSRDNLEQQIQQLDTRIGDFTERIELRQAQIDKYESELGELDQTELQQELEATREEIQEKRELRDERQDKRDALQERRAQRVATRDRQEQLETAVEQYEQRAAWAQSRYEEFDDILLMYEGVKSELRSEYLAYLNRYANEVFDDLYTNSSYQRIIISEQERSRSDRYDYNLQLERDDGTTEDPSNASGGERALVNLALRAGIYRLIAELEGGNTGELPPFILDEPTTFLDEDHVGQLEQMLDTIRNWNVPQVFVVSHNPRLVDGADHSCRVTIDERTNTSSVALESAADEDSQEVSQL